MQWYFFLFFVTSIRTKYWLFWNTPYEKCDGTIKIKFLILCQGLRLNKRLGELEKWVGQSRDIAQTCCGLQVPVDVAWVENVLIRPACCQEAFINYFDSLMVGSSVHCTFLTTLHEVSWGCTRHGRDSQRLAGRQICADPSLCGCWRTFKSYFENFYKKLWIYPWGGAPKYFHHPNLLYNKNSLHFPLTDWGQVETEPQGRWPLVRGWLLQGRSHLPAERLNSFDVRNQLRQRLANSIKANLPKEGIEKLGAGGQEVCPKLQPIG